MSNHYRPTWAEINLDHLWHNFLEAQTISKKEIIPVIKANAYGHGAVEVMQFLYDKGIRICAVSLLEEALELRHQFLDLDIIMMGPILASQLDIASINQIEITIYDSLILKAILNNDKPLTCHLKMDTGMSRYGLNEPDIIHLVDELQSKDHINLKGIYTHFATSNEMDSFYEMQLLKFKSMISKLDKKPKMIHISNSSSAFKREKDFDFTTHIRLGISLYGLSLDQGMYALKPVMSLKSKVVQIKELKPDDAVGYGASYRATQIERVAILPIGYADGLLRRNKTGYVEINKHKYKIVGIICMDALFVKIDEHVHVGDTAIVFGGIITIDDIAKRLHTINYEVVTSISYRVPRIYLKGAIND